MSLSRRDESEQLLLFACLGSLLLNSDVEQPLWQVPGMNKRLFRTAKRTTGIPRIAACTCCGEQFRAPDSLLTVREATEYFGSNPEEGSDLSVESC